MPAVAILGAGQVGQSWASAFVRAGFDVRLHDRDRAAAERALACVAAEQSRADGAAGSCRVADTLAEALADAVYVQESIVEDLGAKRALYAEASPFLAEAVAIGSSTSTLLPSALSEGVVGAERLVVVHPLNPAHLIPVVELCPGPHTRTGLVDEVAALMRALGRAPIVLQREVPGFIVNRLQLALIGEALHLIGEGYCSVADIDTAVRDGLAVRWALLGPLEAGHLNAAGGYHQYMSSFEDAIRAVIDDLQVQYRWSDDLIRKIDQFLCQGVPPAEIAAQQQRRNRMLAALVPLLHNLRSTANAPA